MWSKPVSGGTFNVDDYASGFVRFANNATLSFEVSWAANIEKMFSILLYLVIKVVQ